MAETSIEWTDFSINPIRARSGDGDGHYCEKISPGCKHCYSSRLQPRFRMPQFAEQRGKADVYFDPAKLEQVLKRRKPSKIFWCDMTDMFGWWVPNEWIAACFGVMAATPQHTHQVLTKRPDRALEWFRWADENAVRGAEPENPSWLWLHCVSAAQDLGARLGRLRGPMQWPLPNVWLGTSAEDQKRADERVPVLLQCPAAVRFVSAEPLLGPIDFSSWPRRVYLRTIGGDGAADRPGLNWVIVGGESGQSARPCDVAWIRSIVEQCKAAGAPVFVKQLGRIPQFHGHAIREVLQLPNVGHSVENRVATLKPRDRKGGDPNEWPEALRVRQFPEVRL